MTEHLKALEAFEAWWTAEGQFSRAGGGGYEKTFAFNAWQARAALSTDAVGEPAGAQAVVKESSITEAVGERLPLTDERLRDLFNAARHPGSTPEGFAIAVRAAISKEPT